MPLNLPYYYGHSGEQYAFFRIPKLLLTDDRFAEISTDAKLLYGLLLDRMELSYRNGWIDEQNRVFIIFTAEEVMSTLRCRSEKAARLFSELDSAKGIGLIERKRQGLGRPTTLAREINALVRKTYGGHVFASEIPRSIKAAEISVENKSIYDHDRSGKAALAYENLTREVLSLGKQIKRHRTDPVR